MRVCVFICIKCRKKKGESSANTKKIADHFKKKIREKKNLHFVFLLVFELSVIVFVLGSLILLSLSYFCLGFRIVDSCYCSCVDLEFLNLALDFS